MKFSTMLVKVTCSLCDLVAVYTALAQACKLLLLSYLLTSCGCPLCFELSVLVQTWF